jgi:MFS family permease
MTPTANTLENIALQRSALLVATLTSFMGPFMISAVNVALPAIQADLDMDAVQLSWIATAYLLAVAVWLVPSGKIADIHGRKKIFVAGLAVYTLGSGAAIPADSAAFLIASRILQGFGAAMFVATGMAILTSIFPPVERGRVIGIYVAAVYIGLSVGPFAGGLLTQYFGWRSIFIVMVPLGLFSFLIALHYLKGEWFGEKGQRVDIIGCLLYMVAIFCLVYGATRLPSILGMVLLSSGIFLFAAFFRHQLTARFPVFDMHLFTENKTFTFSSLAALLNYSATFAVTFCSASIFSISKECHPMQQEACLWPSRL